MLSVRSGITFFYRAPISKTLCRPRPLVTTQQVAVQTVCEFLKKIDVGMFDFIDGSAAFVSDLLVVSPGLPSLDSFNNVE